MGYVNEVGDASLVFEILKNAYKGSGDRVTAARNGIWTPPSKTNRGMLYFYLQWPLIYTEIIKSQPENQSMSDADAIEAGWNIFTLMYLQTRQVEAASDTQWPQLKSGLGFSNYSSKPATSVDAVGADYPHHDYLLVVLSLITGRDQTPIFDFWGVQTTQAGRAQAAALLGSDGKPLPPQPVKFYATRCSDDLRTRTAVDMTVADPQFPWPSEYISSSTDPDAGKKQTANANYCNSLKD